MNPHRNRLWKFRDGHINRDGLVLWHEYLDGTATDLSGNGNDGSLAGTPVLPIFDGVDDIITVANAAEIQFGTSGFAIHILLENSGTQGSIIFKGNAALAGWGITVTAGVMDFKTIQTPLGTSGLPVLVSYILVGTVLNGYVNGKLRTSNDATGLNLSDASDIKIGSDNSEANLGNFVIYKLFLYKKAFKDMNEGIRDMQEILNIGI